MTGGGISGYMTIIVLYLSLETSPQGLDKVGRKCYFIYGP